MNILGEKLYLRAIEIEDLEFLRNLINDKSVEMAVIGWSYPVSSFSQKQWFEALTQTNKVYFIMEELQTREAIGVIILSEIEWKNRTATIGIKLDEKYRGKKYGLEGYKLVLSYCFDELQLHKIESCCLEENKASLGLHLQCGFVREGVRRSCIFKGGKYHNVIILGILKEEFGNVVK